ncbi:MAG: DNA primase [Phycisphaerales bacterium]|nr:DNA primase [Phycisphaerales bacterium]MCB9857158.1 DNA primase [Phycisphaerales bacterium]MCB9861715.1 DNA primase [Phycisphaerales bacterium]
MVGRDSAFLTEKIREANDIVDVVGSFVALRRAGKNLKGLCPFHREKTPSFNVLADKQIFKCFGCGAGGDVFKFIQLRDGINFPEAREVLARRAGISLEKESRERRPESSAPAKGELERVNQWAAKWFRAQFDSAEGAACQKYVESRGITAETALQFGLGFAPAGWTNLLPAARKAGISDALLDAAGLIKRTDRGEYDAFRNRLMFPITDALGRIIGFGGRALDDDPAKYLNSPQTALFDKGRSLYGLRDARDSWRTSRRAIITEGYLDCILCHQAGFKDVIATLGTAMTGDHGRLLMQYVDTAVLVFDADEAGLRAADRAIGVTMSQKLDVRIAQVPEGMDPADVIVNHGSAMFDEVLTSSVPALEFKWNQVTQRCQDAASDGDRRRAVEEFLGVVAAAVGEQSIDPIQRGFILNQVGKLLSLTTDQVERQLRMIARRLRSSDDAPSRSIQAGLMPLRNGEQTALRDILSVLLNEPEFFEDVSDVFDPARIQDALDRRVAETFVEMVRSEQGYNLNRMIGVFDDTDTARRITDLLFVGESRGNFGATAQGAADRLRNVDTQQWVSASFSAMKQQGSKADVNEVGLKPVPAEGEEYVQLEDVLTKARGTSHFVARRHLAAPIRQGADRRAAAPGESVRPTE